MQQRTSAGYATYRRALDATTEGYGAGESGRRGGCSYGDLYTVGVVPVGSAFQRVYEEELVRVGLSSDQYIHS